MARAHSLPFDPEGKYVARKPFSAGDMEYLPGDNYTLHMKDPTDIVLRKSRQLLNQRFIVPAFTDQAKSLRLLRKEREVAQGPKKAQKAGEGKGEASEVVSETGGVRLVKKPGGWYSLIEIETGDLLNKKLLRKKAAEDLLEDLGLEG